MCEEKSKEELPTPSELTYSPSQYSIGDFVFCRYRNKNNVLTENFGFVTRRNEKTDYYVVELIDGSGFASCPVESLSPSSRS